MPDGVLSIESPSSYETTLDVKMEWRLYPGKCLKYNASDYQNNNKHVTSIMDASCCSSESFPSDVIRMRRRKSVQGGDGWTAVKRLWRGGRRPDGAMQEGEGAAKQRVQRPGMRRCYSGRRGRRPGRRRSGWLQRLLIEKVHLK